MRFLLINAYKPPTDAPTGRYMEELGSALIEAGHQVQYLGSPRGYRDRRDGSLRARLWREICMHAYIFVAGRFRRNVDVIIALSSPACLLVTASLLSKWHPGSRLIHWAMDVYPETAIALGMLNPDSSAAKISSDAMRRAYRQCDYIVALDKAMADRLSHITDRPIHVSLPWPLPSLYDGITTENAREAKTQPTEKKDRFIWLYSGNLGRAHEWETLLEVQRLLEVRGLPIWLRFQGTGPAMDEARETASQFGLKQCEWLEPAADDEFLTTLLAADVLVVTQRPETSGLLWPSKMAMLRDLGKPVLWVGPPTKLTKFSFAPREVSAIASFLEKQFNAPRKKPLTHKQILAKMRRRRTIALKQWVEWLSGGRERERK